MRNPVEGAAHIRERLEERRQGWRPETSYRVDSDWELRLHELLGASWPCPEVLEFSRRWEEIRAQLVARGVTVGRGAYGGWDDADPALARATWCLVRHLRPRCVVETGVGRGLTSRLALEAMERNGLGHLSSIDQPPALAPALRRQTAIAVPSALRGRWTYVRGSSRRRLPAVVRDLEMVDLFIHDSMHTGRNVVFELETTWPVIRPGGVGLLDDVSLNRGFARFLDAHGDDVRPLIGVSDDNERLLGMMLKVPTSGRALRD